MGVRIAALVIVLLLGVGIGALVKSYWSADQTAVNTHSETPEEEPHVSLSVVPVREETDQYSINAQYPQFGLPVADRRIKKTVEDAISSFKANASQAGGGPVQYDFTSLFDSLYAGEDFVSVELVISEYLGGAHPGAQFIGFTFDGETGEELSLNDVLALTGLSLEQVAEAARRELSEKLGEAFFEEGAAASSENYGTFVVDADSVTFVFQEYQVAPYAAGPQKISFDRVQ